LIAPRDARFVEMARPGGRSGSFQVFMRACLLNFLNQPTCVSNKLLCASAESGPPPCARRTVDGTHWENINKFGRRGMVGRFQLGAAISVSVVLSWSAWASAAPQAQYSVDDIAKSFAGKPSASGTTEPPASTSGGVCESKGKVTGPDGLCYPANQSTAGFNLGRRATTGPAQGGVKAQARATQQVARANIRKDLLITFKLGSADLTDQGRANALVFAKALQVAPQLADAHFQIIGYTDASGAKDKNIALSQRRAEAVKSLLVESGVDGARLTAKGYGARDFLPGTPPTSPANRRVVAVKE